MSCSAITTYSLCEYSLKGNQHGKIFFLHFAFFSSPISIDLCGKRLQLLVKYALSYG